MKWITESPKQTPREEFSQFDLSQSTRTDDDRQTHDSEDAEAVASSSNPNPQSATPRMRQSRSMPHIQSEARSPVAPRWGRLRSLLPHIASQGKAHPPPASAVTPANVNITDELMAGGLATLMLRLWVERDDKGHRRVPALFHRLRIRVSDSLHPLHGHKAVFRIECEYANGALRWVVYRQLREFLSLHGHYTLSNAYNRNIESLPEFPLTSKHPNWRAYTNTDSMIALPYFKFLKERGNDVGRADFARLQRETLENYLIGLIRAVVCLACLCSFTLLLTDRQMFHPAVNRLAGFLELGALTIALAQSGGSQYKAGLMHMEGVGPKGVFGRRSAGWREKKKQRWCAVRESYLVVMEEMGEVSGYDPQAHLAHKSLAHSMGCIPHRPRLCDRASDPVLPSRIEPLPRRTCTRRRYSCKWPRES